MNKVLHKCMKTSFYENDPDIETIKAGDFVTVANYVSWRLATYHHAAETTNFSISELFGCVDACAPFTGSDSDW